MWMFACYGPAIVHSRSLISDLLPLWSRHWCLTLWPFSLFCRVFLSHVRPTSSSSRQHRVKGKDVCVCVCLWKAFETLESRMPLREAQYPVWGSVDRFLLPFLLPPYCDMSGTLVGAPWNLQPGWWARRNSRREAAQDSGKELEGVPSDKFTFPRQKRMFNLNSHKIHT